MTHDFPPWWKANPPVPIKHHARFKLLLSVDGITLSTRLHRIMRVNSALIKEVRAAADVAPSDPCPPTALLLNSFPAVLVASCVKQHVRFLPQACASVALSFVLHQRNKRQESRMTGNDPATARIALCDDNHDQKTTCRPNSPAASHACPSAPIHHMVFPTTSPSYSSPRRLPLSASRHQLPVVSNTRRPTGVQVDRVL